MPNAHRHVSHGLLCEETRRMAKLEKIPNWSRAWGKHDQSKGYFGRTTRLSVSLRDNMMLQHRCSTGRP